MNLPATALVSCTGNSHLSYITVRHKLTLFVLICQVVAQSFVKGLLFYSALFGRSTCFGSGFLATFTSLHSAPVLVLPVKLQKFEILTGPRILYSVHQWGELRKNKGKRKDVRWKKTEGSINTAVII